MKKIFQIITDYKEKKSEDIGNFLFELCHTARRNGEFHLGYAFGKAALQFRKDKLVLDNLALCAYYTRNFAESLELWNRLLKNFFHFMSAIERDRIIKNKLFAEQQLRLDKPDMNYLLAQYTEMHNKNPTYGLGSTKYFTTIKNLIQQKGFNNVLDFGCGKGKLVQSLKKIGVSAKGYDPAISEFNKIPVETFDLVFNIDVLEHFLESDIEIIAQQMKDLSKKAIYSVIHLQLSSTMLPDGSNEHKTIRDTHWWKKKLVKLLPDFDITLLIQEETRCEILAERKN